MQINSHLNDISFWRMKLGLFPVPLFGQGTEENQFVLLNGSRGNFCLDLTNERIGAEARNRAWSSNVGHYVSLVDQEKYVEVQSWDQRASTINRYSYGSVASNLEKFHSYLVRDEPKSEASVVSHIIRVYRSLRSALGEDINGPISLKAFLYLLACVTDGVSRKDLTLNKWGLDTQAANVAKIIQDAQWHALEVELTHERQMESLTPRLSLILRHASGQIFQEAHYEAIFVKQQRLLFEDLAPEPIALGKNGKGIGLHFTPPSLARTVVEESLAIIGDLIQPSITVFDPACGSGEFLRESLRQLKLRRYNGRIRLIGWDISSAACDMAKFVLAWEMRGYEKQVSVQIECIDSLNTEEWPNNVDLVAMNPPFVSWHDMDSHQRSRVKEILGELFREQPDMSNAFLWRAASCLRKKGIIGSILPASFLSGSATGHLRDQLSQISRTRLIARLGSHLLFPGAMIDAALYIGQANGDKDMPPIAFWADYRPTSNAAGLRALRKLRYTPDQFTYPVIEEGYSIYVNPELGKGSRSWSPRPYTSWRLLKSLTYLPKVKDLFDVKEGAKTGHNKTFLLSRESWLQLPKNERRYFRPAVINKSINHGFLTDSTYVFYPHGDDLIESEERLQKLLKTYYNQVLLVNKRRLIKRQGINPEKWWYLRRPGTWQMNRTPKLVSTSWGDAGSFAWDDTGHYVIVQGHGWLLKPTNGFSTLPQSAGLAYLAILNSPMFSDLLSAVCNHVGGGQWDLAKRFVNRIAIPNLLSDQTDPDLISNLFKIGKRIHEGLPFDDKKLNELVDIIYQPIQTL